MKTLLPVSVATSLLILTTTGCERKTVVFEAPPATPMAEPVAGTRTLETARLGGAINDYEKHPTTENSAKVKKAFAELDGEIAELEEYIAQHDGDDRAKAAAKLANMQTYRTQETARFTAAQVKSPVTAPPAADGRSAADKVEDTLRKSGDAIKDAVRN